MSRCIALTTTAFRLVTSLTAAALALPLNAQSLPAQQGGTTPLGSQTATTQVNYSAWRDYDRTQWDLTDADWTRYEEIMRGPRGVWSPNLDPLTALGVEARTSEERQRYAELVVMQEEKRAGKELEFTRAYAAAWAKLYPNAPLFDTSLLPGAPDPNAPANRPFEMGDRIVLFIDTKCTACRTIIDQVVDHTSGLLYPHLDVYVLDATQEQVQSWARNTQLRMAPIERGLMTLNLDEGLLQRLEKKAGVAAPVAYRRRGDEFVPIEIGALAKKELYPAREESAGGALKTLMGVFNNVVGGSGEQ